MAILLCAGTITLAVLTIGGGHRWQAWIDPSVAEVCSATGRDAISFDSGAVVPVGFDVEPIEHLVTVIAQCVSFLCRHVALITGLVSSVGGIVPLLRIDIALARDVIRPRVVPLSTGVMVWDGPAISDEPVVSVRVQRSHPSPDVARATVTTKADSFMTIGPRADEGRIRSSAAGSPHSHRIRRTARRTAQTPWSVETPGPDSSHALAAPTRIRTRRPIRPPLSCRSAWIGPPRMTIGRIERDFGPSQRPDEP